MHEMMVKIDEVLLAELETNSDTCKSVVSNSLSVTCNSFSDGLGLKEKLPKISLKRFHGDPMLLSPFWDSFVSGVDENHALSDVDKFNYLKTLVEGTAAGAICGLPLTGDNYEAAKNILKKRFWRFGFITHVYMESLVNIAV